MNKVILTNGRLVKDVELKGTIALQIARFTVAVNRQFKKDEADFINCVAFGKKAETIEKFFKKGSPINIEGRLQTGSYEKDGVKHFTTDVIVDNFEFASSSKKVENKTENNMSNEFDDLTPVNEIDEELPF